MIGRLLAPIEKRFTFRDSEPWVGLVTGGPTAAGETVTHSTALGIPAYFACIRAISEDCGKLPMRVFKRMEPRGREILHAHPVDRLLHRRANPAMSAMTFRETLIGHALAYHGGFAEILYRGDGRPEALWPMDPRDVTPELDESGRRIRYRVKVDGRGYVILPPESVLHIHGFGFDSITSHVISEIAREAIGGGLAAQKFSGSFYKSGAVASGVLEIPRTMKEPAMQKLREAFAARHSGAENAGRPIIVESGTKWTPQSSSAGDAQTSDRLQFTVEEMARLFRIPPHKIQHLLRSTFSNIVEQNTEYVVDTLLPWFTRLEQEIDDKLFLPGERAGLFSKIQAQGLLRGDSKARSDFYESMFRVGAFSANDILELEDRNPVDGGDVYWVNAAMIPADVQADAARASAVVAEGGPAPAALPPAAPEPDDEPQRADSEHWAALIAAQMGGVIRMLNDRAAGARRRGELDAWRSSFFTAEHAERVLGTIAPAMETLGVSRGMTPESAFSIARAAAARWVERMRGLDWQSELAIDNVAEWSRAEVRRFP